MTTAQVVETSVTVNNNSPIQDYVHPFDQTQPNFEMTPGFKPFTLLLLLLHHHHLIDDLTVVFQLPDDSSGAKGSCGAQLEKELKMAGDKVKKCNWGLSALLTGVNNYL